MSEPRAEMGLRLRDPLNCPISSRSHHLDYDGSVPTSVTLVIGFSPSKYSKVSIKHPVLLNDLV